MSYEIEIKARVKDEQLESVKDAISALPGVKILGRINKFDMYWSQTDDGEPLFRTRREMTSEGPSILFTAKPTKTKTEKGTEENRELEFRVPDTQWDDVLTFWSSIGLQVCRLKWKNGFHYLYECEDYLVHIELLNVKYLGWFLEMEICLDSMEGVDVNAADRALRDLLVSLGISEDAVEPTGYNKMLMAVGHDKG